MTKTLAIRTRQFKVFCIYLLYSYLTVCYRTSSNPDQGFGFTSIPCPTHRPAQLDQVMEQVEDQVEEHLEVQVEDQVEEQLEEQLEDNMEDLVEEQVGQVEKQVEELAGDSGGSEESEEEEEMEEAKGKIEIVETEMVEEVKMTMESVESEESVTRENVEAVTEMEEIIEVSYEKIGGEGENEEIEEEEDDTEEEENNKDTMEVKEIVETLVVKQEIITKKAVEVLTNNTEKWENIQKQEVKAEQVRTEASEVELRKKRTFRKFLYRGVDLDQLLDMSVAQLMELFTCRVRRKLSRGLRRKPMALMKKLRKMKRAAEVNEKPEVVKTHLRNMVILPEMVGSIVGVYNGKVFTQVEVKPEMVGHYLGEFSISYKPVKHGRPGIGATHSSRFIPLK